MATFSGASLDRFIVIPRAVLGLSLDPYALTLYLHLLALNTNDCVELSTNQLALATGISMGQVSKSKRVLEAAGLIRIQKVPCPGGARHIITIVR